MVEAISTTVPVVFIFDSMLRDTRDGFDNFSCCIDTVTIFADGEIAVQGRFSIGHFSAS
jgi:hypothetical protein